MLSSNGSIGRRVESEVWQKLKFIASGDLSESFPSASNSMIIDSIVDPSPSGELKIESCGKAEREGKRILYDCKF